MPGRTPEDIDAEFEEFTDEELSLAIKSTPYAYSITDTLKDGFVYSAKTIGGCFAAVAIAPRALPYVVGYFGLAGSPGVALGTTTAVVGVFSFGAGSKIGTMGAEATLALSEAAVSSAKALVWGHSPKISKPLHIKHDQTGKPEKHKKLKM